MQKLWVIRKSPYRERSLLLTVLTEDNRILRVVGRGGSRGAGQLGEFQPFFAEIHMGRSGLGSLTKPEAAGARLPLEGVRLISALYMNEILYWILPDGVEVDHLFARYTETVSQIALGSVAALRGFERDLLDAAGHYPDLTCDTESLALEPHASYRLHGYQQLVRVEADAADGLRGTHWIALAECRYANPETARHAKWLHRQLIDYATGGRRLVTREMLMDLGTSG